MILILKAIAIFILMMAFIYLSAGVCDAMDKGQALKPNVGIPLLLWLLVVTGLGILTIIFLI